MQMPDMPINVEVDPNEDTEWNDILRSKGIIPEKPPSPTPMIEEALNEARRLAHENRLEGKELDELAELEDDEDEDFLESYRQKRMNELSSITSASIYNQVYHLQKPDYNRDVTEASKKSHIFVLLTSSTGTNTESRVAAESWTLLAQRFGDVKFCQMRADLCIEGYPDRNTPTVLVYRDEQIVKQIVTLRELKGPQTKAQDWEKVLVDLGAVKMGDSRLSKRPGQEEEGEKTTGIRQGKSMQQDGEDSDWD
ncbi:Proteolipid protein 2 [Didymella glomerata]|uniref:Proteolipid protein 2 n=1 Tax=Didymella glomerata TaxID=749621 RepID=A0A9W8WU05_9PLEO|nr:Proteolipid protein 2 [Didymella glomerata]